MVNYRKFFFISLVISLISALAIIFLTTDAETIESLKLIRPEFILLALFFQILSYALTARKTKFLLRSLGYQIHTRHVMENVLTGMLLASLTPASIGGEPVRILLLKKNSKVPVGKATAVIFMERFLDVFFFFVGLIPSMFILRAFFSAEGGKGVAGMDVLLIIGIFFLFIIMAVLIYAIVRPEFAKKHIKKILILAKRYAPEKYEPRLARWIISSENEIDLFRSSFKRFVSVGKINLAVAVFYTVLFWAVRFAVLWLILLGLNVQPDWKLLFATQIVLAIIMIIPATPGASGVAEIAAYTLYSLFVPSALIGIVVIAWRAITYYVNIIAGMLASLKVIRKYGLNSLSTSSEKGIGGIDGIEGREGITEERINTE
ncbi:MAG: flippase-like domain-containing protein [Methanimicrococcus sp.]|nr:flippase-like domain-containing protein [Methanimicrococcus sp.]